MRLHPGISGIRHHIVQLIRISLHIVEEIVRIAVRSSGGAAVNAGGID